MKHMYLILLTTLVFFGCEKSQKTSYEYETGLRNYLRESLSIEFKNDTFYYLLDLQSCDPCIDANLELLMSIPKKNNLQIIFIGEPRFQVWNNQIDLLKKRYTILEDKNSEAHLYELGMFKPLIFLIEENTVSEFIVVSDFETDKAIEFLNKN